MGDLDVDTCTPDLAADEADHDLNRALRAGVEAMRSAARQFKWMLPNPGEMEEIDLTGNGSRWTLYKLRVDTADLPDVWAGTIADIAALPFRSEIKYAGWDPELIGRPEEDDDTKRGWIDSITPDGETFAAFAQRQFETALFEGVSFSLVDNDPRTFESVAARKAAGGRPYVVSLSRSDLRWLLVRHTAAGTIELRAVCFKQPCTATADPDPASGTLKFETTETRKLIVAGSPGDPARGIPETPVRTYIYVYDEQERKWVEDPAQRAQITPNDPADRLYEIPLVPHYGDRIGPWRGRSPYKGTAETMRVLWVVRSQLLGLAREASQIHYHESGVASYTDPATGVPALVGSQNSTYHSSTDPQAKFTMQEVEGKAAATLMKLCDALRTDIERAHQRLSADKTTGPVTATEINLVGVTASSKLEQRVILQEAAWQKILGYMALLAGHGQRNGKVSIPHDFGLPNAAMDRNRDLFIAGKLSPANYFAEAVRVGDFGDDFNEAQELAWHEAQDAAMGT